MISVRDVARAALVGAVVLGLCSSAALAEVRYTVTNLGTLPGGYASYAYGINNSGQVVGYSYSSPAGYYHAFLYSNGSMTDLGTLPGGAPLQSYAYGINNTGQIVGQSSTYTAGDKNPVTEHAFRYSGGVMSALGTLPGGVGSVANGINDSGQVVGYSYTYNDHSQQHRAFAYNNGSMADLGTLGGSLSGASAINNSGQVVGWARLPSENSHAFLYSNGVMADLGTLGGTYSDARGINDAGQVVGYSYTTGNTAWHACLYDGGSITDLGNLPGSLYSTAYGINDFGQIVGTTYTGSYADKAFLYSNGAMSNLNSLIDPASGWYLNSAQAINDSGQIVGYGRYAGQDFTAFLMTPVPEPATLSLLALGGLALLHRRRGALS